MDKHDTAQGLLSLEGALADSKARAAQLKALYSENPQNLELSLLYQRELTHMKSIQSNMLNLTRYSKTSAFAPSRAEVSNHAQASVAGIQHYNGAKPLK